MKAGGSEGRDKLEAYTDLRPGSDLVSSERVSKLGPENHWVTLQRTVFQHLFNADPKERLSMQQSGAGVWT